MVLSYSQIFSVLIGSNPGWSLHFEGWHWLRLVILDSTTARQFLTACCAAVQSSAPSKTLNQADATKSPSQCPKRSFSCVQSNDWSYTHQPAHAFLGALCPKDPVTERTKTWVYALLIWNFGMEFLEKTMKSTAGNS
jgi:hypothetical protein